MPGEADTFNIEDHKFKVTAQSRSMKAEYTIEIPRDWPAWLREQAVLHRKAADELEDVADYLEQHNLNPEHYDQSNNKKLE